MTISQGALRKYLSGRVRETFAIEDSLKWQCPHCNESKLQLEIDDMDFRETRSSKQYSDHPDSEICREEYVFVAYLHCPYCKETTQVLGTGSSSEDYDYEEGGVFCSTQFLPKFFDPPIHLFPVHKDCPQSVKEKLIESFALAWSDFSAAGNKLRTAVEVLIDIINPNGCDKPNLHQKIVAIKSDNPDIYELLMTAKWIGNKGSHENELPENELALGYTIIKEVLDIFCKGHREELIELCKGLNPPT